MSKFSVGYNGCDVDDFSNVLEPYKEKIESVFFGHPKVRAHHRMDFVENYDEKVINFLNCEVPYKKILAYNNVPSAIRDTNMVKSIKNNIFGIINSGKIDGIILADFYIAKFIREEFPNLSIDTSCNAYINNIREMRIWDQEIGITHFNPPREILRMPRLLKEMHDCGFSLKCIINESCLFGCTNSIYHQCMMNSDLSEVEIFKKQSLIFRCNLWDDSNFFRSNWILPRWIPKLEPYVDVFKISSRNMPLEILKKTLKSYIECSEDENLLDIVASGTATNIYDKYRGDMHINQKDIPDKLLTCECKDCNKSCFLCYKLGKKYFSAK